MTDKFDKATAPMNRVILTKEASNRLDTWIETINSEDRGVHVKRHELINWLILNHKPFFSNRELMHIRKAFFNNVTFTKWALKEYQAAIKRGEQVELDTFMKMKPGADSGASERPLKPDVKGKVAKEKLLPKNENDDVKISNS